MDKVLRKGMEMGIDRGRRKEKQECTYGIIKKKAAEKDKNVKNL